MIITIDGPVASGKSTVAQKVAQKLDIYLLNTGYLYRALAYILKNNFNYSKEQISNPDLQNLKEILESSEFKYAYDKGPHVFFKDKEITEFLKTDEIDKLASIISANKLVRYILLDYQRNFAKNNDIVAEGRDTGSVVFPNADYKFFITASSEVRAKRWQHSMEKKGKFFNFEESLKQINERDERDKNREVAPLIIPDNALVIDTSDMTIDDAVKEILKTI